MIVHFFQLRLLDVLRFALRGLEEKNYHARNKQRILSLGDPGNGLRGAWHGRSCCPLFMLWAMKIYVDELCGQRVARGKYIFTEREIEDCGLGSMKFPLLRISLLDPMYLPKARKTSEALLLGISDLISISGALKHVYSTGCY